MKPCPTHTPPRPGGAWAGSTRSQKTGSGWAQQRRAKFVMRRDNAICHVCGKPGADEVDHVIPLAEDGADHVTNMAPIHGNPCHRKKTAAEAARARARNQ